LTNKKLWPHTRNRVPSSPLRPRPQTQNMPVNATAPVPQIAPLGATWVGGGAAGAAAAAPKAGAAESKKKKVCSCLAVCPLTSPRSHHPPCISCHHPRKRKPSAGSFATLVSGHEQRPAKRAFFEARAAWSHAPRPPALRCRHLPPACATTHGCVCVCVRVWKRANVANVTASR